MDLEIVVGGVNQCVDLMDMVGTEEMEKEDTVNRHILVKLCILYIVYIVLVIHVRFIG